MDSKGSNPSGGRHDACPSAMEIKCGVPSSLARSALRRAGIVGVFVPGLPTTEFILAASYLFARSSPALEGWLERQSLAGAVAAALQGDGRHAAQGQGARARLDVDGPRYQPLRAGHRWASVFSSPCSPWASSERVDDPVLRSHDGRTTAAHPVVAGVRGGADAPPRHHRPSAPATRL